MVAPLGCKCYERILKPKEGGLQESSLSERHGLIAAHDEVIQDSYINQRKRSLERAG